jgi:hypothetical protein
MMPLQDRGDDGLVRWRLLSWRALAPRISLVRTCGLFDPLPLGSAARIERLPLQGAGGEGGLRARIR